MAEKGAVSSLPRAQTVPAVQMLLQNYEGSDSGSNNQVSSSSIRQSAHSNNLHTAIDQELYSEVTNQNMLLAGNSSQYMMASKQTGSNMAGYSSGQGDSVNGA